MSTSVSFRHLLTQQQRNNKRQRANPQQLAYLQKMFEMNPRPNYSTREVIGKRIDMTPRSVQIWFQNNRAKLKKSNTGCYKSNLRTVIRRELHNITSVQLCDDHDILENATLGSCYSASSSSSDTSSDDRISIVNCQSLVIGSWVRVRQPESDSTDLTVYTSDNNSSIYYTITHSGYVYTLRLPYKAIKEVNLKLVHPEANQGVLEIDVFSPEMIEFKCQAGDSCGPVPCGDFTGGETWCSLLHQVYGAYDELLEQATPFMSMNFK